jgi:hypothetical protein
MNQELAPYIEAAKAHPYLTAATLIYLGLVALGNVQLSQETAVQWPRFASAWVVAQKTGVVLRGVLKPIIGIALPSAAKQVVEQVWPGALTATSTRPTMPPAGQDGGS